MTASPTSPDIAAFRVSLTQEDLALIGEFTVVWGQIDFLLSMCIAKVIGAEPGAAYALMENMTTGPRLNMFYKYAKERIEDSDIKLKVTKFNKGLSPLIDKRNHLMHGVWGFHIAGGNTPTFTKASFYVKTRNTPLFVDDLPKMIKAAKEQSHIINAISHHLFDKGPADPATEEDFFFGTSPPTEMLPGLEWQHV
jgi:hypothetical protein